MPVKLHALSHKPHHVGGLQVGVASWTVPVWEAAQTPVCHIISRGRLGLLKYEAQKKV